MTTRIDVYKRMVEKYGQKSQMLIAVEEMSELQKEILKYLRGRCNEKNIAEEMADVEIMLEQLSTMFDNRKEVEYFKNNKIARTLKLYLEGEHNE